MPRLPDKYQGYGLGEARTFGPWVECEFEDATRASFMGRRIAVFYDHGGNWEVDAIHFNEFDAQHVCWVRFDND